MSAVIPFSLPGPNWLTISTKTLIAPAMGDPISAGSGLLGQVDQGANG